MDQLLGSQPGLSAAAPAPAVDLERQLPVPSNSLAQNEHSSHNRTPASACKPAVNGDAHNARTPQAVQTSADSRLAPVGLQPATAKQLLPAGVSSSAAPTHSQHRDSTPGQRGSSATSGDALEPSPDSSSSSGNRRLIFCSTGSDESTEMHEHVAPWQSAHVPESVEAAMAAASKVLEERGKIRGMADQERQTLTLHTQARDVYFEAAQKAYERGNQKQHIYWQKWAGSFYNCMRHPAYCEFDLHRPDHALGRLHALGSPREATCTREACPAGQKQPIVSHPSSVPLCSAGDREAAQELAGKGKEHAQLAKEARSKANQAAYDSSNLSVANRFKVGFLHCTCSI